MAGGNPSGWSFLSVLLCALPAVSASAPPNCADHDPARRPFFGDLHIHTVFSLDASTQGTRNRPADAYRFARGERFGIQPYDASGKPLRSLQLARPLDFAAVTDHAEMLGEREICSTPGLPGHDAWICRIYRRWPRAAFFIMNTKASAFDAPSRFSFCGLNDRHCREAARGPWQEIQNAAHEGNDPCRFTSFVGYEWTGAPSSYNLHRNIIFNAEKVPDLPISYIDEPTADGLFERLARECIDECEVISIPHNSNLSGGLLFQTHDSNGRPMTADAARRRARYERLVEVMQHKGDSECMPDLGSEDEACGFEKLRMGSFAGRYVPWLSEPPHYMGFVRNILKEGLAQEDRIGVNPFKLGLMASTDTHLATPGYIAEDETFPGHGGAGKPARESVPEGLPDAIDFNPGGLAVLWAEENTRASLFAAMRRREAYGTSGPRMPVRFFGSWSFDATLCEEHAWVEKAYNQGVPMGSDLAMSLDPTRKPRFLVWALRDAGAGGEPSTPLQRIQIVKGWLAEGKVHERVFEVAGDPDNGADVALETCEARGRGFDELCRVWTDPEFSPDQPAFYYARVLENPVCRWSTRICNANGIDCSKPQTISGGFEPCCDPAWPKTIQERAWTSPIWYGPKR